MRTLVALILMWAFVVSCSKSEKKGSDAPDASPDAPFAIAFENLKTHGQSLSYVVKGQPNKTIDTISFHLNSPCDNSNRVASGSQNALQNGINISLFGQNRSHPIYYKVSGQQQEFISCELLVEYAHDTVSPVAPNFAHSSIVALNGTKTKESVLVPALQTSYLPDGADGVRFYGNISKTQYMGEILRENFSTSGISLLVNQTSNLYISFVDYAGNESGLFNTSVLVTNDSIAPNSPFVAGSTNIHVNAASISPVVSFDSETRSLIYLNTQNQERINVPNPATLTSVSLVANILNRIQIFAIDDVGNASVPLELNVYQDSITPDAPILSLETEALVALPFKGPSNVIKLIKTEDLTVHLFYGSNFNALPAMSYLVDTWVTGVTVPFLNPDGANSLYFIAEDLAGNRSTPLIVNFNADSISPLAPVLSASTLFLKDGFTQSGAIEFKGTTSGDAYSIKVAGGATTYFESVSTFTSGFNYSLKPNQVNTLYVSVFDLAGNESPTVEYIVTHDTIAPIVNVSYPLNGRTIRTGGELSGVCESQNVIIEINSGSVSAPCSGGLFSYTIPFANHGQNYIYKITETDLALNSGSRTLNFTIDNIAPILTYDLATVTGASSNKNHIVTGTCEPGLPVYVSGDSAGVFACFGGSYIVILDILTEGSKTINITQTDYALNETEISFDMDFDFTAPPQVVLDQVTTKHHLSAVDVSTLLIKGTLAEDASVIVSRNNPPSNVIGTYTKAQLEAGFSIPLLPDTDNLIYVFASDLAGNRSLPAFLNITHRSTLSKKFVVTADNINTSNLVGEGVIYRYKIHVINASYDTNTNKRIAIPSLTTLSSSGAVTIDPASSCLQGVVDAFGGCDILISANYTRIEIGDEPVLRSNTVRISFPDGLFKDVLVRQNTAPVKWTQTAAIADNNLASALFSENLRETVSGNSFTSFYNYVDFNFEQNLNDVVAVKRKFMARSADKVYTICEAPVDRVCVSATISSTMPEHYFVNPAVLPGISGWNSTAVASQNGAHKLSIHFVGTTGTTDILLLGESYATTPEGLGTAILLYDKSTKTSITQIVSTTGEVVRFSFPHTGNFLHNNKLFIVGHTGSASYIYSYDIDTGFLTRVSQVRANSGYMVVGNKLYFTETSGALSALDTSTSVISAPGFSLSSAGMICDLRTYTNSNFKVLSDRFLYFSQKKQGVLPICTDPSSTYPKDFYYINDAGDFNEIAVGLANYMIRDVRIVNDNSLTLNLRSQVANPNISFYANSATLTFSDYFHSSGTMANNDPGLTSIGDHLYLQKGYQIFEVDSNLNDIELVHTSSVGIYMAKLGASLFIVESNGRSYYYDPEFKQTLPYSNLLLSNAVTLTQMQGILNAYLYGKRAAGSPATIYRFPLYVK